MAAKVFLHELGMVCALGDDLATIAERVCSGYSQSLTFTNDYTEGKSLPVGEVKTSLPSLAHLPSHHQTRSNQLLLRALQQIERPLRERMKGINPTRIGVVLGASTSGIREGEKAMAEKLRSSHWPEGFSYLQQEMSAPAQCLAEWLAVDGPAFTISTACSSSAKALASARRLLRHNICDLVIAGGVDSLCQLTVNGFGALDSVSEQPCVPFSANRNGINIGEGAALFILSREPDAIALAGVGETSDAHHISAPAPDGKGAIAAMQQALTDAKIEANEIGYLNLHGTATEQNDAMESRAVNAVFGAELPCSSTKGYTGHTLGAAGAIEAGFCWLTLRGQNNAIAQSKECRLPLHRWDGAVDSTIPAINLVTEPRRVNRLRYCMSNSFAFGGNNIALLLASTNS